MKKIILFFIVCLSIFLFSTGYRVQSDGMNASLHKGDFVFVWPLEPQPGDIVLMQNPLWEEDSLLRRVIAIDGFISYDRNGTIVVDGQRISQQDMGTIKTHRIIQERIDTKKGPSKKWCIQRLDEPILLEIEGVHITQEHMFVLADRRDEEVDSRYWGEIPKSSILGVVVLRIGTPDSWNDWYTIFP